MRFVYFLLLGKTGFDLREGSGESGEGNQLFSGQRTRSGVL